MSEIQLPALSGLNKPELQAAYTKETGQEPGELTVDALRAALAEHRATGPVIAPATPAPSRAADTIAVVDATTGLEHDLPQAVWKELGEVGQAAYTVKADKPTDLK